MDYVYGELCQKVVKNTYEGGRTSTAEVTVDNARGIIYVVAHADSSYVEEKIADALSKLTVEDVSKLHEFVTVVQQQDGKITVTRRALSQEDIPDLEVSKIYRQDIGGTTSLKNILVNKQDTLGFEEDDKYPYDKDTNKVITKKVMDEIVDSIIGATHFRGTSIDVVEEGSLVTTLRMSDGTTLHATVGDIVNYPDYRTKWYFTGKMWTMYENYSRAIIHQNGGDITDSDIKEGADIAQRKVHGLVDLKESVDILNSDSETIGSVLYKIMSVVNGLDVESTDFNTGEILSSIKEQDGKIITAKRNLVKEDIPIIEQSQVNGLTTSIMNINSKIASMDLDEVEIETGKILFKIKEEDGKVSVETRAITSDDIPTISYSKVSGLASVASSGNYKDLSGRPTLTYDSARHCIWINSTLESGLWTRN